MEKRHCLQAMWCLEIKQLSENQVSGLKEHLLSTSYILLPVLGSEEFRDNVKVMVSRGNQFSRKIDIYE